jgi:hypothetical protein
VIELWTRKIVAADALPFAPDAPLLAPGRPEDVKKLIEREWKHPLMRTVISGPARSRQEEKWYRGLVGVVAEGIGMEPNTLHFELKYYAGKILGIVNSPALGPQVVLQSSTQMDDEEFHIFVTLATEILFQRYLPGARRSDVFKEVEHRVGHGP